MDSFLQVTLFFLVGYFNFITCAEKLPCQRRLVPVPTLLGGKAYLTPHVQLLRCSGGDEEHARYNRCIDPHPQIVKIDLINADDHTKSTVEFHNETNCGMRCVCEANGVKCPDGTRYAPTCERGYEWDAAACECVTPRIDTSIVNLGCNKKDGKSGDIKVTTFIIALIIEFVAVLIIVFLVMDVCKYRKHSKGVIYKTAQYVRQISNGEREGFRINTLKRERDQTGSISFLYDVNNGNVPNGKVAV